MHNVPSRSPCKENIAMTVDSAWRVGIVYSSFYPEQTRALVEAAQHALRAMGIPDRNVQLYPVPGSFEVPLIGAALAQRGSVDALIGIGIIVEGETHHAEILAREAAHGMMDVQTRYGIPFAFEILYVHSLAQAAERADKGREAALAAVHSLAQLKGIQS